MSSAPPPYLLSPLPHLAVFSADGPDAGPFLQGQLTQDVLSMRPEEARPGGYCSAKGRLLGTFAILRRAPESWWFVTHAEVAPALVKRLKMFVLRAKCTVDLRPELRVWGTASQQESARTGPATDLWQVSECRMTTGTSDSGEAPPDAVLVGWFGGRTLCVSAADMAPASPLPSMPSPAENVWQHADVLAGWPWIQAATVEQFVPQMVNFEVLGGVNFRKGCYPGQEVVARSQYRGTLKRRMVLVEFEGSPPLPGTEVFDTEDAGQPAGMVVNAASDPSDGARGVALVEVKIAAKAAGRLHLGSHDGAALSLRALPYAVPMDEST